MTGSIFSLVPADGGSRAGTVSEQLSRSLAEGLGHSVLLADFDTRRYSLWCTREPGRRLDGKTWGAFVHHCGAVDVLDAREVQPKRLAHVLDCARKNYAIVCAELTGAKPAHALEVLRASDGIFLVASSNPASLAGVREKAAWLRSMDMGDRCGLLLQRVRNGVTVGEVEELTGLPVSSLIENHQQVKQLASWLAANRGAETPSAAAEYACAV